MISEDVVLKPVKKLKPKPKPKRKLKPKLKPKLKKGKVRTEPPLTKEAAKTLKLRRLGSNTFDPAYRTAKFRRKQLRKEFKKLVNELPKEKPLKLKGQKASRKEFRKLILRKEKIPTSAFRRVDELIKKAAHDKQIKTGATRKKRLTEYKDRLEVYRDTKKTIRKENKQIINKMDNILKKELTGENQFRYNIEKNKLDTLLKDRMKVSADIKKLMKKNKEFLSS